MKFLKSKIMLLIAFFMISGCATKDEKKEPLMEKDKIVNVEFFLIKLYTKENLDSSKIIDSLNIDLKNNIDITESLSKYGNNFLETKLILKTIEDEKISFGAGNTSAYVAEIKDNKLIIDYYRTGISGDLKVSKLDDEKYIVDYKIESSNLIKLEPNAKNKITYTPYVNRKEFYQSIIATTKTIQAVAINNTDAKQYDIIVIGIK